MIYNYKCLDCNLKFNIKEEDMIVGEKVMVEEGVYFSTWDAPCPECKEFAVCENRFWEEN